MPSQVANDNGEWKKTRGCLQFVLLINQSFSADISYICLRKNKCIGMIERFLKSV